MIDIGGRRLRLVCAGPDGAGGPVVVLEAGAFGFSADWAEVQDRLAARGLRSLAYDRAGLGFSDPGPEPRDGIQIARDLERLLAAAEIAAPYVLCGHSMAGLRLRQFAAGHAHDLIGVVLVDAATPEASDHPAAAALIRQFAALSQAATWGVSLALLRLLRGSSLANRIELSGEAEREKRRFFAEPGHIRVAAQEVALWPVAARQAAATPFAAELPVAVVTAGALTPKFEVHKTMQALPARTARYGWVEHVAGASHTSLLGPRFADRVVAGVMFVLQAGRPG
jgi:pimeloyl-ACP methyl ester carboxylesterase